MKLFHKLNGKWSEVSSSNSNTGSSDINLPEGGSDGYLLSKSGDNLSWTNPKDVGTKLPEDGLSGQVLSLDNNKNLKWNSPNAPVKLNVGDLVYTFNDTPPANTFLCDSSIVDKNSYPELYSVIGDKFTSSDILSSSEKSVVPIYSSSVLPSLITETTSDLSLGENSYYSYVIDNKIKLTCIGINGGIYNNTGYPAWKILDDALTETEPVGNYKVTYEIEYLDDRKFAPYMYRLSGGNAQYSGYHLQEWDLYGYNGSEWVLLDEQSGQYVMYDLQTYKLDSYSINNLFSKFRLVVNKSLNNKFQFRQFYIYGTKEGEASIYDGFALPPSSTNESGAKACIVHSSYTIQEPSVYSEEEMKVGMWIDGKPIYRRTFNMYVGANTSYDVSSFNIDKVVNLQGILTDSSGNMWNIPYANTSTIGLYYRKYNTAIIANSSNNGWYGYADITIQYTKTTD